MTFLKKLGQVLAMGIAAATGLGPLVSQWFGAKAGTVASEVTNDLSAIGNVVVGAETFIQAPGNGAAKLAAAAPLVANVVRTSELVSGRKIANESLFIKGCTEITSGTADVLNSLSPDGVQSTGQPITVTPAQVVAATASIPEVPATAAPAAAKDTLGL